MNKPKNNILYINENDNFIFEYINCKEKILLPLLYKMLIKITSNDKIEKFIEYLNNKYRNKSSDIKILLGFFNNIKNILLVLLSIFYARIYTKQELYFFGYLNKDLRETKRDTYLPYIKLLYEDIKLKSLKIAINNIFREYFL